MAIKGNLRDMHLTDIIQLTSRNRDDAKVTLTNAERSANIYMIDGQVVHAKSDTKVGEEAFYELLSWQDGTFVIEKDVRSPQQTIQGTTDSLLLRGLQYLDESRHDGSDEIDDLFGFDMSSSAATEEDTSSPSNQDVTVLGILQELADSLSGLVAAQVVREDGHEVANLVTDTEVAFNEQGLTSLSDVVDQANASLKAMDAGAFQETITLTTRYRYIIRPIGKNNYHIRLILNENGSIGAARMYLADKEEALMNTLLSDKESK